jgi:hypothetical protein
MEVPICAFSRTQLILMLQNKSNVINVKLEWGYLCQTELSTVQSYITVKISEAPFLYSLILLKKACIGNLNSTLLEREVPTNN